MNAQNCNCHAAPAALTVPPMFCFQCEQTAGGKGCSARAGVCGKTAATAHIQDELTGALVMLGKAATKKNAALSSDTKRLILEGLFATLTNVNFDDAALITLRDRVRAERNKICCRCPDFATAAIWGAKAAPDGKSHETAGSGTSAGSGPSADIGSLKTLVLLGLRGLAAYAHHAAVLGYENDEIHAFILKAFFALTDESLGQDALLPLVLETGKTNLAAMELLDRANTETFGSPVPTKVGMKVAKGPFIVVSGHDLHDLKLLLEQSAWQGVDIYTHGEMLPAHAYPELKKFPHLRGHIGTAWQNQQKEFDGLPAPILFTTNCIMPPKPSYADRVFTTGVVGFPGLCHIRECGGVAARRPEECGAISGGFGETALPETLQGRARSPSAPGASDANGCGGIPAGCRAAHSTAATQMPARSEIAPYLAIVVRYGSSRVARGAIPDSGVKPTRLEPYRTNRRIPGRRIAAQHAFPRIARATYCLCLATARKRATASYCAR